MIHTRKFFCDKLRCLRHIFTETFPGVLAPYARRTQRLEQALLELVHVSNAESAAGVGGFLGYPTSPDTLLRCQRQEPISVATPRVLGVDEFALRRGCTYATILVDLERRRPVDILEGKQAQPLTQWLRDHPGVDILPRDRGEAYALAGRTGIFMGQGGGKSGGNRAQMSLKSSWQRFPTLSASVSFLNRQANLLAHGKWIFSR